jgi:cation diffusion facilitator family transporter
VKDLTGTQNTKGWLAAWISLISNFFLTVVKVIVGTLFGSTALIADGVHNGADFIASIATLSSMKLSHQPADKEHPYGHGKAEDIATGIVALLLTFAGIYLIYESIGALFHPASQASLWALAAAFISLVWKLCLYLYTHNIGKQIDSKSLIATAYDHLADVWASLAAVFGIGFAKLGDIWNLPFAVYGDPIAGIIVSLLILKVARDMGVQSVNVLMESNVSVEKQNFYESIILSYPVVKRIDLLRAREHGNYILIDIRLSVPGEMTIKDGHDITRQIRDHIRQKDPKVEEVLIHLNPWFPSED